ncbi:KxYKxGKxW signal peptide domain-containing protein [Kineosporia babensis]
MASHKSGTLWLAAAVAALGYRGP